MTQLKEEDARYEFNILLNDDDDFANQWDDNDEEQLENNFYEWCSLYDDLEHIKQTKENEE